MYLENIHLFLLNCLFTFSITKLASSVDVNYKFKSIWNWNWFKLNKNQIKLRISFKLAWRLTKYRIQCPVCPVYTIQYKKNIFLSIFFSAGADVRFTGGEGVDGKKYNCAKIRNLLNWKTGHPSFKEFMANLWCLDLI